MMKINYFDCIYRFKPEAGYGCNCSENKGGKCILNNKLSNQLDECEFAKKIDTNINDVYSESRPFKGTWLSEEYNFIIE